MAGTFLILGPTLLFMTTFRIVSFVLPVPNMPLGKKIVRHAPTVNTKNNQVSRR
jgi:hypothetical protein